MWNGRGRAELTEWRLPDNANSPEGIAPLASSRHWRLAGLSSSDVSIPGVTGPDVSIRSIVEDDTAMG